MAGKTRWLVFARGARALPGLVALVAGKLHGLRLVLVFRSGRRRLMLDGRATSKGFELRFYAAQPDVPQSFSARVVPGTGDNP